MPAYIKLCMKTWKFPYTLLTYDNLHEYTNVNLEQMKRFSLPQQADIIRAHVLRDHGGYYLDTDNIILSDTLPEYTVIGYPETRAHTTGFLYASEPHMDFLTKWAAYQDRAMADPNTGHHWSVMVNDFTDPYLKAHREVQIGSIKNCWPETYMIPGDTYRRKKYEEFYFNRSHHLSDIQQTDMLMLHNSWTPDWYKKLSEDEVLSNKCTLSNILREVL